MTPEELALLDRGILPKNQTLTPEEVKRWLAGGWAELDRQLKDDDDRMRATLDRYRGMIKYPDAAREALGAWMEWKGGFRDGLFGFDPVDMARHIVDVADPILAYSSRNQTPGRNWSTAECYLVGRAADRTFAPKTRALLEHPTHLFEFGYLAGPYNVENGVVEREPGCQRRIWKFGAVVVLDAVGGIVRPKEDEALKRFLAGFPIKPKDE